MSTKDLPRRKPGAFLRCGCCFRDLTTEHGKQWHTVYRDGSMRCFAPESYEHGDDIGPGSQTYVSTHVVFDSPMRRRALDIAFVRGDIVDPHPVAGEQHG